MPDERWGERPLACVVREPGADLDARRGAATSSRAASRKLVDARSAWSSSRRCPKTSVGKFSKKTLRERFAAEGSAGDAAASAAGDLTSSPPGSSRRWRAACRRRRGRSRAASRCWTAHARRARCSCGTRARATRRCSPPRSPRTWRSRSGWAAVLARVVPPGGELAGGVLGGLAIAALDLAVIAPLLAPRVRALPQGRQWADHVAFGLAVGAVAVAPATVDRGGVGSGLAGVRAEFASVCGGKLGSRGATGAPAKDLVDCGWVGSGLRRGCAPSLPPLWRRSRFAAVTGATSAAAPRPPTAAALSPRPGRPARFPRPPHPAGLTFAAPDDHPSSCMDNHRR